VDQLRITNGSAIVVCANHLAKPSPEEIKKLHHNIWPVVKVHTIGLATHILDKPIRMWCPVQLCVL
jgi:hypothetical protein